MTFRIVSGTASPELAGATAAALGTGLAACRVERFPDGELRPGVGHLRGADVYVVQSTGPPVNENIMELLLLLDACRRAGAGRVTVVVPYFGYARQDRRGAAGEAVGARVVADTLMAAGAQRLVVVDPHTAALESMCAMPVEMVSAVPTLADALAPSVAEGTVVVAPDLGAVKLAEHYASLLRCPVAVVRKTRVSGARVHAEELIGGVEGRSAIVIDDMVSTGGTIEAAVRVLLAHGAEPGMVVAATHGLLVGGHTPLSGLPLRRLLTTDTVEPAPAPPLPVQVRSVAPLLADTIGRLHRNEPLDDLRIRT
ncbi:ribose-phosphate diphosphokinase [Allosalinactinospora lopnorensis]|uniref:ribose-phosphate diphosphokinase n=1 Tax=Allosalinactinospora lopnorensis TaxID=1352348 RepID=UPI000623C023|nr:ribose-phosphate pyrophosphokinase [Allosalinactinospora lopnorensis]